jgi:hypothetical protein
VGFLVTNRETVEFVVLITGAAFGAVALLWWFLVALRAGHRRGPLVFAVLGALFAVAPFAIHARNGSVVDLGRPVQLLDGQVEFGLTEPGGINVVHTFGVGAFVAAIGIALFGLALLRLMLGTLRKENWTRVRLPVYLLVFAAVLVVAPFAVNIIVPRYVDLGPRETVVNGDVHLTLTGWDRKDYSVLRGKARTTLLQMANGDVTDETLENLRGMTNLRELDLSNTRVTDAGLAALEGLPLERLRLARTQVTDAGFKDHLDRINTLKMLDLSGTAVTAGTIDEWKKRQTGRRVLH